ncbi:MAG: hypothetical protein ACHQJ6_08355, partial [Candidatus Berkiellales bacterium]
SYAYGAKPGQTAEDLSWDARKRVAFYYLALQEQDPKKVTESRVDREGFFIGEIFETRRAHNFGDPEGKDDPSCYPGTVGRMVRMGRGHRDLVVIDPIQELSSVIQSLLQQRVGEAMKDKDEKTQAKMYWSLLAANQDGLKRMLTGENVLSEYQIPEEEWINFRQEIISSLGTIDEVFAEINQIFAKAEPKIRPLEEDEKVYVARQLLDINYKGVGQNVAEKYRHLSEVELVKPDSSKKTQGINPIEAQQILSEILKEVKFEKKLQFIATISRLCVTKEGCREAIEKVKEKIEKIENIPPEKQESIIKAIEIKFKKALKLPWTPAKPKQERPRKLHIPQYHGDYPRGVKKPPARPSKPPPSTIPGRSGSSSSPKK